MLAAVHLTAHVTTESSKGNTVKPGPPVTSTNTDDLSMQRFIKSELPTLQVPNYTPQSASNQSLKRLTALRRELTPLLVGRRIMTGLTYNGNQVEYFDRLVTDMAVEYYTLMSDDNTETLRSHRLLFTTAVVATLLVSGALILHIPSDPALHVYEPRYEGYINAFKQSLTTLNVLARDFPYARRVREECRNLVDIGSAVADRWFDLKHPQNPPHSETVLSRVLDPVRERMEAYGSAILPYQALSPPLQGIGASEDGVLGGRRGEGSGVLWFL